MKRQWLVLLALVVIEGVYWTLHPHTAVSIMAGTYHWCWRYVAPLLDRFLY
jgi:hypothetical protein